MTVLHFSMKGETSPGEGEDVKVGRAIVGGVVIVLVVVIVAWVLIYHRHQEAKDDAQRHGWAQKGDLNKAQEEKLQFGNHQALSIFTSMLLPHDLDSDMTVLSKNHRRRIEQWVNDNGGVK